MADKNDGSKGDPKKPKPLLDLKATEVPGAAASRDKPAPTSTLKGAPGWKEPAGDSNQASGSAGSSGSSSSQRSSQSPASSKPSSASASESKTASSQSTQSSAQSSKQSLSGSSSSSSSSAAGRAATGAATAGVAKSAAGGNKPASGSAAPASKAPKGGEQTPPPTSAKSGGGFGSTLSHLVAGVVGGGIALFAAQPIEQGLGIALTSSDKIPAGVERRLAALEARPTGAASDPALGDDVSKLRSQVTAAEERLAGLDALGKQVASLSSDVKKVQSSGGTAGAAGTASSAAATSGDGDGQTTQLRARLAKLESAFSTLSSATGSQGNATGIAPLAQFSGKFADLENSLNTQLSSLRKSLMSELNTRVVATSDSTAKAVAGAERLDREVSEIKTDTARLEQRSTVLKTASDKLAASMRAISEQAAELKVELDALKGDVKQELAKVVRPGDVQQAIAPVSKKVASIEKNLGSVLASETARKENAERIVLSLELSNLKRVLDRGSPYAAELDDVKKIAGDTIDFGSLDEHKSNGVPSGQELTRQFRDVAYQIINAEQVPKDGSRMDRLFAAAKSIVQVRRTDIPAQEKTAEAAVARIEKHLKAGDMSGALALAEKLPEKAKAPAKGWLSKLSARAGVDRAIAKIEGQLKASLGAAPVDKKS